MKLLRTLFILMIVMVGIGAFGVWEIKNQFEKTHHLAMGYEVTIPKGASLYKTAQILVQNRVIDKAWLVLLYARIYGLSDKIKAGEYYFENDVSIKSAMDKIVKGDVIVRLVTIPEGKSLYEIKNILMNNPYLVGDITVEVNEGDILPETYHFAKGESRDSIVLRAKDLMKEVLDKAFNHRSEECVVKTKEELLILASIVEKETGIKSERALVASVFSNRLRLGMRLQTDPTVIYAVTDGRMDLNRPLYKKDLAFESPYNTYVYEGLPLGPICSPGREAIEAVATPDKSDYLYFVADGVTGGHRFAKSLLEHNKNVAHYRRVR